MARNHKSHKPETWTLPVGAGEVISAATNQPVIVIDGFAAIGVLGDNMRTGTAAGTDIKAILASLASPSDAAEDALYRMGLTVDDVNIKQRGLIPVLETLKGGVERLQEQGLEGGEVWDIFGRKGANALKILTGQIDRVKELENELDSSTGTAKRLADVMSLP